MDFVLSRSSVNVEYIEYDFLPTPVIGCIGQGEYMGKVTEKPFQHFNPNGFISSSLLGLHLLPNKMIGVATTWNWRF